MTLNLYDETEQLTVELREIIEASAIESARFCNVSPEAWVDILIVDLANMQQINKETRGIDAPTDVLAYPTDEPVFLGDIVIAYEKIISQAEEYGHSTAREAGFLTIHAMLHLLGYDHDDEEHELLMRKNQAEILDRLGLVR